MLRLPLVRVAGLSSGRFGSVNFHTTVNSSQQANQDRSIIHEDERMTALKNALICTVLASAGNLIHIPKLIFFLKRKIKSPAKIVKLNYI